jgi:zinc transporter, ZIP family
MAVSKAAGSKETDADAARGARAGRRARRWLWGLMPLLLLAALIAGLLRFGPLGVFQAAVPPVEELTVDRVRLEPGRFIIRVTNGGPEPVTVAQVLVDDAYWQFEISPGATISRLGTATITVAYPWVEGEAHHLKLLSSLGTPFEHTVDVATASPRVDARYLGTFTLLGVYVGILPVFLGLLWLPFVRRLDARWTGFFLSLTAGLLVFLGVDALDEALAVAAGLPGAFQGVGLIVTGVLVSALLLVWVSRRFAQRGDAGRHLGLALLIAVGIGLHNLGEGLAIGAAYSLGKVALGTFLVLGFTIHNTTEGLAIVTPIARERTALATLVLLGVVAGAPTILGALLGGLSYSPVLATLFLAVGAGAIFQVVYELIKMMIADGRTPAFGYQVAGFAAGLLVMYLTGLFVAA